MFPTEFYEHIDRPVNLDAHRWQLLGFSANRGHNAASMMPVVTKVGMPLRGTP